MSALGIEDQADTLQVYVCSGLEKDVVKAPFGANLVFVAFNNIANLVELDGTFTSDQLRLIAQELDTRSLPTWVRPG